MKKTLLAISLIVCSFIANAQYSVGVKGGLNLSSVRGDNTSDALLKAGFNVGVVGNYEISDMFSAQAEILFSAKGYKTDNSGNGYTYDRSTLKYNYIEVPLLLKASIGNQQGIQGYALFGPSFNLLTSSFHNWEYEYISNTGVAVASSGENNMKDYVNTFDLGLNLGVGATYATGLGKIFAEARYGYGLSNLDKQGTAKYYNTNLQFSVGYLFAL